jgi:hypothetical protein
MITGTISTPLGNTEFCCQDSLAQFNRMLELALGGKALGIKVEDSLLKSYIFIPTDVLTKSIIFCSLDSGN